MKTQLPVSSETYKCLIITFNSMQNTAAAKKLYNFIVQPGPENYQSIEVGLIKVHHCIDAKSSSTAS